MQCRIAARALFLVLVCAGGASIWQSHGVAPGAWQHVEHDHTNAWIAGPPFTSRQACLVYPPRACNLLAPPPELKHSESICSVESLHGETPCYLNL